MNFFENFFLIFTNFFMKKLLMRLHYMRTVLYGKLIINIYYNDIVRSRGNNVRYAWKSELKCEGLYQLILRLLQGQHLKPLIALINTNTLTTHDLSIILFGKKM